MCAKIGGQLREALDSAVSIVNTGAVNSVENAQARADRLIAVRLTAIKHVEDFYATPRFLPEED